MVILGFKPTASAFRIYGGMSESWTDEINERVRIFTKLLLLIINYYLPHHGIYHAEKSSTCLCVPFNALAHTSSGLSLNDILLKWQILQQELFSILIRFCKHHYAFTTDIGKVHRIILIHSQQRDLFRIIWKDDIDAPIKNYKLNNIT